MGYFLISEEVVDRNDLTLEEKMACIVLARYADIKVLQTLLSLDIIAVKMGCSIEKAQKAIDGLVVKGVLTAADAPRSAVLPRERAEKMPSYVYHPLETTQDEGQGKQSTEGATAKSQESSVEKPAIKITGEMITALKDYFEEIVSESHIRVLLNLTSGDMDAVKRGYDRCRSYPSSVRIDQLADLLQSGKNEATTPVVAKKANANSKVTPAEFKQLKAETEEDYSALIAELETSPDIKQLNQQINVKRIHQMYSSYGKKTDAK